MTESKEWYRLSVKLAAQQLGTDIARGLTAVEAAERLSHYGPNEIREAAQRTLLHIFLSQFADFMILVLLAAAVISGVIGDPPDTIAIIVIVMLNAVVGAVQEYRAQRAVAALRKMAAPQARAIRNGSVTSVSARELVPGDVLLLGAGDVVSADVRLLEVAELQTDESALTGESQTVQKRADDLHEPQLPLGDRLNMAYKGTLVTRGHASGLVVATGMATELGHIAELLQEAKSAKTPLQQRLARFGRYLALAILVICAVIFIIGLLQGQPLLLMFLTAVSLAVAAIPEALPAVVTISLALGARKLSHRNALARQLPAVETLGSITYICADKTGTLTQNRMSLQEVFADGKRVEALPSHEQPDTLWQRFGQALALNNEIDAQAKTPAGDPTEIALYLAAQRAGFHKAELARALPRVAELVFDSERQAMTTLHTENDHVVAFTKGAPEKLLMRSANVLTCKGSATLNREEALAEAQRMAAKGNRVLAVAYREFPHLPDDVTAASVESDLTLLGLVALIDPPREEVPQAVADCQSAGITPVMITGDHPVTARKIAVRLNIAQENDPVVTGQDLAELSDAEFASRVRDVRIYARVDPEQKIRIVTALQSKGEFVAMTGDGVNDAPALKQANIGVAMGQRGTEVAREAADIVLLDDNFATIVSAAREGRRIFDDIRKFIKYTMTSNSGEIWTLFLAPFLGLPIPLLPIHILWINLVTDGLPGLALAAEPAERDVMHRPPRPPRESIFAHGMWQHMIWVGLLIGGLSIIGQAWAYRAGVVYWQTVVFTVLTLAQLFHAMAIRAERDSLFRIGLFSNPHVLGAVLLTVGLQLAIIYIPAFNMIFKTHPLPVFDLAVCFALASLVFVAVEFEKWLVRQGWLYTAAD